MRASAVVLSVAFLGLLLSACNSAEDRLAAPDSLPAVAASAREAPEPPLETRRPAPVRQGGAIVRGARNEALYVADEDHEALRIVPLPAGDKPARELRMPGAPAQVLALDGRLLVTIRDPGLLLVMRPDPAAGLVEAARVPLPPDAWGVAVTPDERIALVSSAWTNKVSAVDLDASRLRWTVEVAREPRAIVVKPGGTSAYVTHLAGAALTRIDAIDAEPVVRRVDFPPAPASAPIAGHPDAFALDASLAYSAVLSPSADRLFVPRHALGAYGRAAWFGRAVVDVLVTADESPLSPARTHAGVVRDAKAYFLPDWAVSADGQVPLVQDPPFVQPRAIAYRQSTATLLVASEGDDRLAELDARSLDPAIVPIRRYDLGGIVPEDKPGGSRCGAPSGLALSPDESEAYVYCRSTGDLAVVALDLYRKGQSFEEKPPAIVHLAEDTLSETAAIGRRLFYSASDAIMSQGLGCAGCHPEGREDGHVWQEQVEWSSLFLTAGPRQDHFPTTVNPGKRIGFPRQTPMLVSRVAARGPYGWHGDGKTLEQRVMLGFERHGWGGRWFDLGKAVPRANALAAFLREGLVPPPQEERELTDQEQRGHEVFMSSETQCSSCHFPATDYTDRRVVKIKASPGADPILFAAEPVRNKFKTPSLLFVGRTAPYFHDGSAASLEELIEKNDDRMGRTKHLSPEDRAALVAYLKTIGTVSGEAGPEASSSRSKASAVGPAARVRFEAPPAAEALQNPIRDGSSLVTDPPSEELSARPTREQWETAAVIELPHQPEACRIQRLREWVRIRCKLKPEHRPLAQVTLVAGSREGVELSEKDSEGEIVMPVRRGDRRVLEFDELIFAWKSAVVNGVRIAITEAWLAGEAAPVLTVTYEAPSTSQASREKVL